MKTSPRKTGQSVSIASLKRGDSRAFAHFVKDYQDMVFACCRTVGLREDEIEDIASETFLAAFKSIKNYSGKSKLSSWLWKIAYHKALDYRKKEQKTSSATIAMEAAAATIEASPETELSAQERNNIVWETVRQLPEPQAAAIVLHYREEKSVEDIANILDAPENTVKTWLHRGRSELYSKLQNIWETNYVRK